MNVTLLTAAFALAFAFAFGHATGLMRNDDNVPDGAIVVTLGDARGTCVAEDEIQDANTGACLHIEEVH